MREKRDFPSFTTGGTCQDKRGAKSPWSRQGKASTRKNLNSSELDSVKWLQETNFVSDLELDLRLEHAAVGDE